MVAEDGERMAEMKGSACGMCKHEADTRDDRRTDRGCLRGKDCRAGHESGCVSEAEENTAKCAGENSCCSSLRDCSTI